ncbi:MAG TPA: hypothetical protein DCQ92_15995 [Verrucomicrobia subdivision 3 bacterium]|nr:hypothetical protein [Limisphaerales bacterium]
MKLGRKIALLIGCLFMLTTSALAADNAGGKSDLSATATESYQIRNKKFTTCCVLKEPMVPKAHALCYIPPNLGNA